MALNPTPYSERGAGNTNGYQGYIQEVTLPSGNKYELVDAEARNKLDTLSEYTQFLGVTTSSVTDGSTATVVVIDGSSVTAVKGNIVIVSTDSTTAGRMAQEYIFDGSKWQYFGDISANNLGSLAYKNNAKSGSTKYLTGVSVQNTSTADISLTASYQPAGTIALTDSTATLSLATTSTTPSNTANYWVYNAASNISITANIPGTNTGVFVKSVTGRTVVSGISTAAPTATVPSGGITYATVDSHNLQLGYLIQSTTNAISGTATAAAVTKVNAPSVTYSGITQYVKPLTVTRVTSAAFTGTTATVTSSGKQTIATITSTSSVVTVS